MCKSRHLVHTRLCTFLVLVNKLLCAVRGRARHSRRGLPGIRQLSQGSHSSVNPHQAAQVLARAPLARGPLRSEVLLRTVQQRSPLAPCQRPLATADQTVASLQNWVTSWAGPGSFAVPLILLGCLTWHLAGRGVAKPAGIGWGLAAWCFLGGVLLVPSPYFAGIISGALIILATRKEDRPRAARDPGHGLT